jgi:Protein of unknown function (DUF2493).
MKKIKVVIAGSRDTHPTLDELDKLFELTEFPTKYIDEVVSGTAKGMDQAGELWALEIGIPIKKFPADWKKYDKAAGPIRNGEMAAYADAAFIVVNNESKGSLNMAKWMADLKKFHVVVHLENHKYIGFERYFEPELW